MKKRGMKRRVEMVRVMAEKRGMAFRERSAFFMMTPPSSIPTATAGRFIAPGHRDARANHNTTTEPNISTFTVLSDFISYWTRQFAHTVPGFINMKLCKNIHICTDLLFKPRC